MEDKEIIRLYEEALKKIAMTDYRGNKSSESTIAYLVLLKVETMKQTDEMKKLL